MFYSDIREFPVPYSQLIGTCIGLSLHILLESVGCWVRGEVEISSAEEGRVLR